MEAGLASLLVTAPWTLALIVALFRGYSIHVTREPRAKPRAAHKQKGRPHDYPNP